MSATPRRSDGGTLKIFAASGPLLYDTTADIQISKGRLCDLDIQYHLFDHGLYNDNDSDLIYSEVYQSCIVNNENRNNLIARKTFELLEEERFVLILIQIIDHGFAVKEALINNGLDAEDVRFIWGDTPDKIRNQAIEEFRQGKFKVFIGSTIADAGLDIKIISGVILAGAGNSDITLIQRIGRGARNCDYESILGYTPKFMIDNNGKKKTTVIDILDTNVAFFKKQAKNRFYNARDEFGDNRVRIVGADQSIFRHRSKKKDNYNNVEQDNALRDMFSVFDNVDKEINSNDTTDVKIKSFVDMFK
ncbi:MAG: DEAD/DEAH box helicase [Paraclostridium sp.]